MNIESNRLNTFATWSPSTPVDALRIARAGFFYKGRDVEVECFSCGSVISQWIHSDQVLWRHRSMAPNCAFLVNSQSSGNVPMVLGRDYTLLVQPESTEFDDRLTEEDSMYKNHILRLLSFVNWEDSSVSREALVGAGFYHMGGGHLRCAWCAGELAPFRQFGSVGTPMDVHRMYFPSCPFLPRTAAQDHRNNQVTPQAQINYNALNFTTTNASNTTAITTTTTTANNTVNASQSSGAQHNQQVVAAGETWRELGVVGGHARHPLKSSLAARLATFNQWPVNRSQTPRALADAGFYYTGVDDQVRCYYCDGGLGKWEQGDAPWTEHARWFPRCGYVLLVKGQEFIDGCQILSSEDRTITADRSARRRSQNQGGRISITDSQVEECMGSSAVLAALAAGLDMARIRRAVSRRLRTTGLPFSSAESLIDAVLDEQLNEEAWSATPQSSCLARDILSETTREFLHSYGSNTSNSDGQSSRSASPLRPLNVSENNSNKININTVNNLNKHEQTVNIAPVIEKKKLTLEEENRQLKEARLCKVCMDNEVSVVFLPCGHLVACAGCGASLSTCPVCRGAVRALVRAYLG